MIVVEANVLPLIRENELLEEALVAWRLKLLERFKGREQSFIDGKWDVLRHKHQEVVVSHFADIVVALHG